MTLSRASFYILLAVLLPIFSAGQSGADIVRPFWGAGGPSARATGLGGAFTGVADDQSALFYNPAGLGHMIDGEINIGFDHSSFDSELASNIIGTGIGVAATRLANLGIAMPVTGTRLTWAAGYNLVHSFERKKEFMEWHYCEGDDCSDALPDSSLALDRVDEDGNVGNLSLGLGYQVSPKFALGAAMEFMVGRSGFAKYMNFSEEDSTAFQIAGSKYKSFNLSLGLLLAPLPNWRVGLLLRTPQRVSVEQSDNYNGAEDDWEFTARGPYYLRVGTSYTTRPLLIAADIAWYDYSQIELDSDGLYEDDIYEKNYALSTDYESVLGYSVGGEYLLPFANAKLRGGYRFTPSIRNDNGASGARAFAFGFSALLVPQLKIDLAYSLADWSRSANENWVISGFTVNLLLRM